MAKDKIRFLLFFSSIIIGFIIVFLQINKMRQKDIISENIPIICDKLSMMDGAKDDYDKLTLWASDKITIKDTYAYKLIDEKFRKTKLELGKQKDKLLTSIGSGNVIHSIKYDSLKPVEIRLNEDYSFEEKLEALTDMLCRKIGSYHIENFVEDDHFDLRNQIDILLATESEKCKQHEITPTEIILVIIPSILSFAGLLTWISPLKQDKD